MMSVTIGTSRQGQEGTCHSGNVVVFFVLQMLSKVSVDAVFLCIIFRKWRQLLGALPPNPHW